MVGSLSRFMVGALLTFATSLGGCGADALYPGGDGKVVVLSGRDSTVYDAVNGGACIVTPQNPCLKPQSQCGDGERADVILGSDGKVLTVVCYPARAKIDEVTVVGMSGPVSVDNKDLILIDGAADGPDIVGDLTINGNNSIVYGAGPAVSVIGGNLDVVFNNGVVRGVSILGDVNMVGNNTALIDCVILGNVTIRSNNNVFAGCDVYGKVTVTGNNNWLTGLRVQGGIQFSGSGSICDRNFAFVDRNQDKLIDPTEVGAALACK
ncbi:MAG: hypothetical protein U1A78_15610 [Polyangia bacterium]